jgi:methylenetetrahydrofolate reductase (NADPH)
VKAGITAPILPGILPIENWAGAKRFAARCGATPPAWLDEAFEHAIRDDRHDLLAIAVCSELCTELLEGGAEDLHFYTLNKPQLTREVARAIGVVPQALEKVA